MSTIFVHVGQCGTQIAAQLWDLLAAEIPASHDTVFDRTNGCSRAIFIDSEPKVVRQFYNNKRVRAENVVCHPSGRGNNWAMGYDDPQVNGEKLGDRAMEIFRREVERSDYFAGAVLTHSLAGGTGSGLGSRLLENLRTEYPTSFLTTLSVYPNRVGEIPLQNYNSTFALSHLQQFSDSVMFFQNDDIGSILQQSSKGKVAPGTEQYNEYISCCFYNLLLANTQRAVNYDLLYNHIAPWRFYKFFDVTTYPLQYGQRGPVSTDKGWAQIFEKFTKSIPLSDEVQTSVSNNVVIRGEDPAISKGYKTIRSKLRSILKPVAWSEDAWNVEHIQKRAFARDKQQTISVTLASNRAYSIQAMAHSLERAKIKFDAGAYLHWYARHNWDADDFRNAFENLQTVIDNYNDLKQ